MAAAQSDNEKAFGPLPPSLAGRGFALRPKTDEDIPSLHRHYTSTRAAEQLRASKWCAIPVPAHAAIVSNLLHKQRLLA